MCRMDKNKSTAFRKFLLKYGLTASSVSDILGVDYHEARRWELGECCPPQASLIALAALARLYASQRDEVLSEVSEVAMEFMECK